MDNCFKKSLFKIILIIIAFITLLPPILLRNRINYLEVDTFQYLRTAVNLFNGRGFLDMCEELQTHFPPFYPVMIGLVNLIIHNPETSALFISFFSSSLSVLLVYLLAKRLYSKNIAVVSCVFFALLPLRVWSAYWIMTEALYLFLVLLAIFCYLKSEWKPFLRAVCVGSVFALAYLTRPEAAAYPAFIILYKLFFAKKECVRKRILFSAVLFLSFTILIFPYLYFLRIHLGYWTLSGKTNYSLLYGTLVANNIPTQKIAQIAADGKHLEIVNIDTSSSVAVAKRYSRNLIIEIQKLLYYLGPKVFFAPFLIIAGVIGRRKLQEKNSAIQPTFHIQLIMVSPLFIFNFIVILDRFLLQAMPIFCIWMAVGLSVLYQWLSKRRLLARGIVAIYASIIVSTYIFRLLFLQAPPLEINQAKELGFWLRSHEQAVSSRSILAVNPAVAYYADMRWMPLPYSEFPERILTFAKEQKISYLLATNESFFLKSFENLYNEGRISGAKLIKKIGSGNFSWRLYQITDKE